MLGEAERRVVWVVDDSQVDAERARRILAPQYSVEVFRDGSAALECLASHAPPMVMVLDWVMPGVSGVEVCRFLRAGPDHRAKIAIVLLTAHRHTDQIVEGLSAGANDYLAKPYEDEELRARVASQIRAQELLERALLAESLNRHLLETAPDPLITIDGRGKLGFANEEACKIFSRPAAQLLGKSIAELMPDLPPLEAASLGESLPQPLPDTEIDGRLFSPTVRLLPGAGAVSATISMRDVTERRRLDERRLDFYSIIAHDLRTPLNAISLRTHLMLRGRHGNLSDGLAQDIRKIDQHISSLMMMINDFLELARFEDASYKIARGPVDLGALLERTMDDVRPLMESNGLLWRRLVPEADDDRTVVGDSRRLAQVLGNLLANAINFTPRGGTITAGIEPEGDNIRAFIADTGPGIAPEVVPKLFQRYSRARKTENQVAGTGLGLMIVREIIEAHGGRVGVDSTLGQGSRFWFVLPRST